LTKREELIWLAAFFEGEGCITVLKSKSATHLGGYQYLLRITVANCHRAPLLRYQKMFGGQIHGRSKEFMAKHSTWNRGFQWICNSHEAIVALSQMLPFLETKMEQAEMAIEFQSRRIPGKGGARKRTTADVRRDERAYKALRQAKITRH
jgi:hypothetical protein